MEDEKLAAYYDDLTRRGGGAARFKQGLGFSSNNSSANDVVPARGSALPTTSSLLSSFVRASSPSKTSEFERQAQVQSIQNKLSKKPKQKPRSRSPNRNSIRRSLSRDSIRDKHSRRRSRSRDRQSRRRSRSRDDESRRKYRSRSRSRENNRNRSKRQDSPEERRLGKGKKRGEVRSGGGSGIDFAKLIEGYDKMSPAERVKAKMKVQLSKTAENDETIGKGSGWERFEFNKDAPLDDEEVEAVEDDGLLVKRMGQSFRFSAVQARKEEELKAAHDEAMFGRPSYPLHPQTDDEAEEEENKVNETIETAAAEMSLLSDQVLTMQKKGSWRERALARARDRGREL